MREDNPLVSIIVITYNSAKFVLETLESAKAQTYQNIELIVSDDCSQDNTVEVCKNWIEENDGRFVRTELITTEKNSGISPNCNRGLNASNGEWIKFIAGDDVLEADIIFEYIRTIAIDNNIKCLYSNVKEYRGDFDELNMLPIKEIKEKEINQPQTTAQRQFEILLRSNTVWAATLMFNRQILIEIGGFNENYPFFEDRPLLLALTKLGVKIYFVDMFGAKYRRHVNSVQIGNKSKFLSRFKEDNQRFFVNEYIEYYKDNEQLAMKFILKKNLLIKKIFSNRNNAIIRSISIVLDLYPKLCNRLMS
jgi:alpha-1,3-rhamnosyltransferase